VGKESEEEGGSVGWGLEGGVLGEEEKQPREEGLRQRGVGFWRPVCRGEMELLCLGCLGMAGGEKWKEMVWKQKSQSRGERRLWLVLYGGRLREEMDDGYLGLAGRRKRCWAENGEMALGGSSFGKGKCVVVGRVWGWRGWCWEGEACLVAGWRKKSKPGGAAVWLKIGWGLGVFFFQNYPLFVYVLETPIYRSKNCLVSKLGPSTLFFCKFWFCLIFLYFFENEQYQRRLKWEK